MKSRTITVSVLVAVVIIALWWVFAFSPARSEASKVAADVDTAKAESRTLETQNKQLEDLKAHAPQIEAERDRLRNAVPEDAQLASFIQQANQIATATGVKWASVSPTEPAPTGTSGTIALSISVSGDYYQVLDYINQLEGMPRLVVVDQISLTSATDVNGAATVTASLTGRMFTQGAAVAPTPDATTPTSVAGGGGVAAPAQNENG